MGDEEENDDIVGKEYPGGRVGLNCRVIKEPDQVVVEEINHGFINDGYDDYLYEDNGDYPLELSTNLQQGGGLLGALQNFTGDVDSSIIMDYLHVISQRYLLLSLGSREMEDFKVVSGEI